MISGVKTVSSKDSEDMTSAQIMEFRRKIHDAKYIDSAIQRIASVLSKRLIEEHERQ
ncbi:MAG: hypothetical protein LKF96_05100 [Treponema sp.]|jgi:exosome complex RNA-binding protein Rrp4|nr:hypothetical protein [Treponema sp.]